MKLFFTLFLSLFLASACSDNSENTEDNSENTGDIQTPTQTVEDTSQLTPIAKKDFSYKVLLNETGNEWGYQLFEGANMVINQMHIPAIQGNYGFETKEKAEIAALFILNKLENDIFPPAVNQRQLDSLGVLPEVVKEN